MNEGIAGLLAVIEEQGKQIAELQRWKDESLEVEASWDCQAVGKIIGVELGKNIRKDILPFILKQKARIKELEGALELTAAITDTDDLSGIYRAVKAAKAAQKEGV